jgi:ABC-type glycerol-3-phosphate transport system substrate-binding protein
VTKIKLVTKRSGNDIVRAGAAIGTSNNVSKSQDLLYALMLQNEVSMTSEKIDLATFNLPSSTASGTSDTPGKKVLDFYKSFSDPGSTNYTWNASMPNDVDAFLSNKVAIIFANQSLNNYLAQKNPDFNYSTAPFPQVGTDYNTVMDYASFSTLAVPAVSKYPDIAWQVIKILSGSMANSYARTIGLSSSEKLADFTPTVERDGGGSLGAEQAQTAHTWIKGRYPNAVDTIFREVINNVSTQGQDTQTALDLAAAKVTDLLRKDSW